MTALELELIAALRESVKSLEWAATVIGDIPPKSHYMESLQEARDLIAEAEQPRVEVDLLAALKDLLDMPEPDGTFSMGKLRKSIKDKAKAAIAKAEVTS